MKKILIGLIALGSISSFASEITCSGQSTKASIVLDTSTMLNLQPGVYHFKGRVIPTSGFQFGIMANKEDQIQVLTYKFKTLKKHALAPKNSNLVLTIKQKNEDSILFNFILNEAHEAELRLEVDETLTLLDKLSCR